VDWAVAVVLEGPAIGCLSIEGRGIRATGAAVGLATDGVGRGGGARNDGSAAGAGVGRGRVSTAAGAGAGLTKSWLGAERETEAAGAGRGGYMEAGGATGRPSSRTVLFAFILSSAPSILNARWRLDAPICPSSSFFVGYLPHT